MFFDLALTILFVKLVKLLFILQMLWGIKHQMHHSQNRAAKAWQKSFIKPSFPDYIWFGFDWVIAEIQLEQQRWFMWQVVFFACGILAFHTVNYRFPNAYLAIFGVFLMVLGLFLRENRLFRQKFGGFLTYKPLFFATFIIIFCGFLGFFAANIQYQFVKTDIIKYPIYKTNITGIITDIQIYTDKRSRLLIKPSSVDKIENSALPKFIRINLKNHQFGLNIGDQITTTARLFPLPKPAIINGYDFGKNLYYQSIGATGSIAKKYLPITDIKMGDSRYLAMKNILLKLRLKLAHKIEQHVKNQSKDMLLAILIGLKMDRSSDAYLTLKNVGLAHLLAISGLHMGLVMGLVFYVFRLLLALFPVATFGFSIKKIAAVMSLAMGLFYLLITGGSLATERAFIMAGLIMLAVLVDREALTMRNLALALLVMLVVSPISITNVGFQMSFAATAAIIFYFEWQKQQPKEKIGNSDNSKFWTRRTHLGRSLYGLRDWFMVPLLTGLATMPISIFHFSTLQTGGLFANLVIVPLFGILVMPLAMLALFTSLFGLEHYPFKLLNEVIDYIYEFAHFIFKHSYINEHVAQMNIVFVLCLLVGFIWLIIWQNKWRYLGGVTILAAFILPIYATKPILYIGSVKAKKVSNILILGQDEQYHLLSGTRQKFNSRIWLDYVGQPYDKKSKNLKEHANYFKCDKIACIADIGGLKTNKNQITLVLHFSAFAEECKNSAVVIAPKHYNIPNCSADIILGIDDLKTNGIAIFYENGKFRLQQNSAFY